jgi:hypothetical protein
VAVVGEKKKKKEEETVFRRWFWRRQLIVFVFALLPEIDSNLTRQFIYSSANVQATLSIPNSPVKFLRHAINTV